MSKIRKLLDKLKKKKKSSDDLDQIFYEQDDAANLDEADQLEDPTTKIVLDDLPDQGQIAQEIDQGEDFEFEDIDEVFEEEVRLDVKKEIDQEDGFDYTFNNKTFTGEIDLDNDKISIKDKIEHLGTRIVDRFRNFNKKDLNQAMKPPRTDSDVSRVNIEVAKLKDKVTEVQWNKFIDRILNPKKNQKVHHYFQICIGLFLIFVIAEIIGIFIQGRENYAISGKGAVVSIDTNKILQNADIDKVRMANVFKTSENQTVKKPVNNRPKSMERCLKADAKSSLPIKLHHTIVLQDSVKSIASVTVRSNKVTHIREGEKINNMAKVDKIDRMEMLIRNLDNGNCESISSSKFKPPRRNSNPITLMNKRDAKAYKQNKKQVKGIQNDGNKFTVERAVLKEKLQDMSSLLTQARAIQINNPDGTLSFKIVEVQPDSVFAALGIGNGDIITNIGGEPIKNLNQIMSLFGKIGNLDSLKLGLSRSGEEVEQNYTIK